MKPWSELDKVFKKASRPDEPGGSLGIFKNGRAIYLGGYGSKQLGHIDPITSQTVFNLASVSKQFTAFCILLLQERGKLSLDDDLCKHLPEFRKNFSGVKIRHLIHHTSGMISLHDLRWLDAVVRVWQPGSKGHIKQMARQKERNFSPGEEHLYNNDGYLLLAEVVRRCSGQVLADFAELHIFKPLKMTRTRFVENDRVWIPERALGHRRKGGSWVRTERGFYKPGPGDLWSCAEDLGRWAHSIQTRSLGGPALYRAQAKPGVILRRGPLDPDYAAGLGLGSIFGKKFMCHGGLDTGFCTVFYLFPKQGLTVVFLRNREEIEGLSALPVLEFLLKKEGKIAGKFRSAKTKPLAIPKVVQGALGCYQGLGCHDFWELRSGQGCLNVNANGLGMKMVRTHEERYVAQPKDLGLAMRLIGGPNHTWSIRHSLGPKKLGELRWLGRPTTRIPALRTLVGSYRSALTGKAFSLRAVGSKLFYRGEFTNGYPDIPLRFLAPDKLVYVTDEILTPLSQLDGSGYFEIRRDKQGRVRALQLVEPAGRNRSLNYQRLAVQL